MVRAKKSRVIWITGASSGLGRSLALTLAEQGHWVIASARNEGALATLEKSNSSIIALPCDVTDPESMKPVQQRILSNFVGLDQVILNAGTCEYLEFPEPDWAMNRRVMEANFFGTVNCLEIALPMLRQSTVARPHIVVIGSQVTHAPFAKAEAYGASKAALQYYFDSLRIDLAPENIDVSIINPGFVDTPLTRKNKFDMPFLMSADEAARRIIKHLPARPRSYSFPKRLRLLLLTSRLMPGIWQKKMSAEAARSTSRIQNKQDDQL